MSMLTICPCCSSPMIHYIHPHRESWFCRSCWQEMPDFSAKDHSPKNRIVSLSPRLVKLGKAVAI